MDTTKLIVLCAIVAVLVLFAVGLLSARRNTLRHAARIRAGAQRAERQYREQQRRGPARGGGQ